VSSPLSSPLASRRRSFNEQPFFNRRSSRRDVAARRRCASIRFWPQPLPNHWVFGSVTGVAVDAQDHVWVTHRGADSLEGNEKGMMANPPTSAKCCVAAPFILEFDPSGKLVSNFGGPGQGYQWPQSPGGIAVDAKGNIWIAAAGLEPAPPGGSRSRNGGRRSGCGRVRAGRTWAR